MELVTLYRDGTEAVVDKDIEGMFENFIAAGWAEKSKKAEASAAVETEPRPVRKTQNKAA